MAKRTNSPQLHLSGACCVLFLAAAACSRAIRYGMDAATQTGPAAAAEAPPIIPTFEDPDWFVFLAQTGAALVQQATQQTLPEAYKLHHAAFVGDEVQLEACIKAHPKWINKSTKGNATPLHLAVFQGKVACVRLLLDAGADPRALMDGVHACMQPIHIAAHGNAVGVLRALLEAQPVVAADVDATGKTALHWAAAKGKRLCVDALLQAGSAPNREDAQGHTPLCLAFAGNHADAAAQLVEAGAHIECVTCMHNDSDWLLRWALAYKAHTCVAAVIRKDTVPVDLFKKDVAGETLLDCALRSAHLPSIRNLLQRASGSNWMNHRDQDGIPLLHRVLADNDRTLLTALLATTALDVNAQDATGKTALHLAAEQNLSSAVQSLLAARGIEVNRRDNQGSTALYTAAAHQHWELARILMQLSTIEVLGGNPHNQSLLEVAFGANYLPFLEKACDAGEEVWVPHRVRWVNHRDRAQTPLLHRVLQGNHLTLLAGLLAQTTLKVNAEDAEGKTALCVAIEQNLSSVVQALLQVPGIEVHAPRSMGEPPLHLAARLGRADVVEELLQAPRIEVNAKDQENRTPLHWAASLGHADAVRILLKDPGIEVNARDELGETPLHWAARGGHDAVQVHARDALSETPLRGAAGEGYAAVVEALLQASGIQVNAGDECYNTTPLHLGAEAGNTAAVQALLKAQGIQVNAKDDYGWTPLHKAAYNGRAAVVEALLKVDGIEVNAAAERDKTPLKLAQERRQYLNDPDLQQRISECITLLEKA